jgi:glyoxylase-like metal-dependent hydrolase (beta-lactamase superfamily II)
MAVVLTRRRLLSATAAGAVAAAWPRAGSAQAGGALALTALAPDLALIAGAGANVVALVTADGLLLVDSGAEAHSPALQRALAERWPSRPLEVLFNTNWRHEHTGGNATLRGAGGVMAHENTKLWLGGDFFVEWEHRHYAPRPASMLPNKTFYTSGELELGRRRVEYWYLPRAHTDGDVAVFFPEENVLVASDLLSVGRYPVPDYSTGGWIGGLVEAAQKLLDSTDAETRIVAAEGGVYGRAQLEAQLELCTAVRLKAAEAFRAGMSLADFVASKPTAAFDAQWGDPTLFLPLVYKGGFAHLRELGGVI